LYQVLGQLVSYAADSTGAGLIGGSGAAGTSTTASGNNNRQGDIMSRQDIRLSGAVCFMGSNFAISCSAEN
jgi:hypothetical protein